MILVAKGKQRGGLLLEDPKRINLLENLATASSVDNSMGDNVLKRLRQAHFLRKDDIKPSDKHYNLLYRSCKPSTKEKSEYFMDWDPAALKEYDDTGNTLLHLIIPWWSTIDSFT